ncbi:MAG: hypothetical protein IT463_11760 [Planctomycetes bacterium]|nr:hypothetical protein [Planctomycetota bacterium]
MSIVSCASCGAQYNAAGYQPGVQFQCTGCGAMVTVGKAAGGKAAGPKRATGAVSRGRPAGPARAGQGGAERERPMGPPAKKGMGAGAIVGIIVGVVVVAIVALIAVFASKPSPQEDAKAKLAAAAEAEEAKIAREDAERKANNDRLRKTMSACVAKGAAIETALRGGDWNGLKGMFDWQTYSLFVKEQRIDKDPAHAGNPFHTTGKWEQVDGKVKWVNQAPHGADTAQIAVMEYMERAYAGSPAVTLDRVAADNEKSGFGGAPWGDEAQKLKVGGKHIVGKILNVTVQGAGDKPKEFWVGAECGSDDVRIIYWHDASAKKRLSDEYIKANKKPVDDRSLMNDDRDPMVEPGTEEPGTEDPPAVELPAAAKTGAKPTDAALVNILNAMIRGDKLTEAQKSTIVGSKKAEKKAMLGGLIDALLDAHNQGKRREKAMISNALLAVWGNFARSEGFLDEEVTYDVEGRSQSDNDEAIRRWCLIYNKYDSY